MDTIKGLMLTAVIGGVLFAAILWFFERTGSLAWVIAWVAVTVFQIFIIFVAPWVIMPLFNKFTPLEEGELKTSIEKLAASQDFQMRGIFRMDASKRSSKSNALFTGFGKSRRIVLFDTLIEKHTVKEVAAILAHEIGHYKKGHIIKAIVRGVIVTGVILFLFSCFVGDQKLFAAFKVERVSVYAGLVLFGFLYTPLGMAVSVVENAISRSNEREADAFAARATGDPEALITGLKKLSTDNFSNLTPHPLKVILDYSHPPVLERIRAIRDIEPRPRTRVISEQ